MKFPEKLNSKLNKRVTNNALRTLTESHELIDFSSNDYLGYAQSDNLFSKTHHYLIANNFKQNGSTGSRLLSGNHNLYPTVEELLCNIYNANASLIFNSGYDANIGLFSSVPQRNDIILYDELVHASIRDGIRLSKAKAYKFKHNNIDHLGKMLKQVENKNSITYVVTESVFSMDGDSPNLNEVVNLCKDFKAYLIVDEAHAIGIIGESGFGLLQDLELETEVFARLITFGKALGCHGAAILGSQELKDYLVNFARSFIYTTALAPHALATIKIANEALVDHNSLERKKLLENILHFKSELIRLNLKTCFIDSNSAIHSCIVSGNNLVKSIAFSLKENGFDVKPILSPTVPKNQERLRFCLHTFNTSNEISEVLTLLSKLIKS